MILAALGVMTSVTSSVNAGIEDIISLSLALRDPQGKCSRLYSEISLT